MADVRVYQNPKAENMKLRSENLTLANENNRLRAELAQLKGIPVEQVAKVIPISQLQAPAAAAPLVHQRAKQFQQQGRAAPQMTRAPSQQPAAQQAVQQGQGNAQQQQVRRQPIMVTMGSAGPQVDQGQAQAAGSPPVQGETIQSGACSVVIGKLPPGAGRVPGTARIMPAAQVAAGPPPPVHVLPPEVQQELDRSLAAELEQDEGAKRFAQIELK